MKTIHINEITAQIREMCMEANFGLSPDMKKRLQEAGQKAQVHPAEGTWGLWGRGTVPSPWPHLLPPGLHTEVALHKACSDSSV